MKRNSKRDNIDIAVVVAGSIAPNVKLNAIKRRLRVAHYPLVN